MLLFNCEGEALQVLMYVQCTSISEVYKQKFYLTLTRLSASPFWINYKCKPFDWFTFVNKLLNSLNLSFLINWWMALNELEPIILYKSIKSFHVQYLAMHVQLLAKHAQKEAWGLLNQKPKSTNQFSLGLKDLSLSRVVSGCLFNLTPFFIVNQNLDKSCQDCV